MVYFRITKKPYRWKLLINFLSQINFSSEKKRVHKNHYLNFLSTKKVIDQKNVTDKKYMKILWLIYFLVKKIFMHIFSLSRIFQVDKGLKPYLYIYRYPKHSIDIDRYLCISNHIQRYLKISTDIYGYRSWGLEWRKG